MVATRTRAASSKPARRKAAESPPGEKAAARGRGKKVKLENGITADHGQVKKEENEAPSSSFYLMKSEPESFSIDDLASRAEQTEPWDGAHGGGSVLRC